MSKVLFTLALALLASGCALDNAIDCHQICNRYQTCFNASYDVDACAARCRTASSNDGDYKRKADVCNACIDDRSCSSATFSCGSACGAIVP